MKTFRFKDYYLDYSYYGHWDQPGHWYVYTHYMRPELKDGYVDYKTGKFRPDSPDSANGSFSAAEKAEIEDFIASHRAALYPKQFEVYYVLPEYYVRLRPQDREYRNIVARFNPYVPHIELSAQFEHATKQKRDYRFSRAFVNHTIHTPVSAAVLAEWKEEHQIEELDYGAPETIVALAAGKLEREWSKELPGQDPPEPTREEYLQAFEQVDSMGWPFRDTYCKIQGLWRIEGIHDFCLLEYNRYDYDDLIKDYVYPKDGVFRIVETPAAWDPTRQRIAFVQ